MIVIWESLIAHCSISVHVEDSLQMIVYEIVPFHVLLKKYVFVITVAYTVDLSR